MAQAAQRFALDLANAFARQPEFLTDLFKRVLAAILQTEAQAQNAGFAGRQRAQYFFDFFVQQVLIGALGRRGGRVVFDEVAEFAVLFLAHRMFETERTPAYFEHPLHFAWFKVHFGGDFFSRWFAPVLLLKLTGRLVQMPYPV